MKVGNSQKASSTYKVKLDKKIIIKSNADLNNIKSSFVLKNIFSFINEKNKLDIIKYNKNLLKKLNIGIEDYKKISGKYIEGERNGYAKEYDDWDNLLFEGEYLNGKKNGKGKEYFGGYVKFEGKYKNGKRNGHGKEYDYDKLIFEGYYLNGKRNGKGKEYNNDGKLIFEGDYLNGERWNGQFYDNNNNTKYNLINGNGKVKEYCSYGKLYFEGEFRNGKKNGKCKEYDYGRLQSEGEYLNGEKNGKFKEYYKDEDDKLMFEGNYKNGKKNGKCIEYDKNGNIFFEGEYLNGKIWNGKFFNYDIKTRGNTCVDRKIIFGKEPITNVIINGNGKVKEYNDRGDLVFEGEYKNGERNGKGKEYDLYGKLEFEGEYLNGEKNGKVKEYYSDGELRFEGEYKNGRMNGKGKEYYSNGELRFEGEYLNFKKWNGKLYEYKNDCDSKKEKKNNVKKNISYVLINGSGKVKEYDIGGKLVFEGEYKNGEKYGKGKEYNYNDLNLIYEGEFKNGRKCGKGKEYYLENGKILFEGEYRNSHRWNGKIYNYKDNTSYDIINGSSGKVKEYDAKGKLYFEGEYFRGTYWNGKGECEYEWKNGEIDLNAFLAV